MVLMFEKKSKIDMVASHGMGGYFRAHPDPPLPGHKLVSNVDRMPDIENCQVVSAM